MNVIAIKTRRFQPPNESIDDLLAYFDGKIKNGSIVALSSKVVSICEGSYLPVDSVDKQKLLAQESETVLSRKANLDILLTKKSDMLLEYGGVDSLSSGYYVLLPRKPYKTAKEIWKKLRKRNNIRRLGVIITDSHSVPYRKGAIGMAISGYGFKPTAEYRTRNNNLATADVIDGLAASANLVMGEAEHITPLAVIDEAPDIKFFDKVLPASVMRSYMYIRSDEVYNLSSPK